MIILKSKWVNKSSHNHEVYQSCSVDVILRSKISSKYLRQVTLFDDQNVTHLLHQPDFYERRLALIFDNKYLYTYIIYIISITCSFHLKVKKDIHFTCFGKVNQMCCSGLAPLPEIASLQLHIVTIVVHIRFNSDSRNILYFF